MLSTPDFAEKQIVFALLSRGERMSFKNDNLIIMDQDKKIKHQSTCHRLFILFVVGHISITSGLIQRAKKFNFNIVLMSHNLKPYAILPAGIEGNVLLRKKQYDYNELQIAQYLIINKINNQLAALKNIRNKDEELKKGIRNINEYITRLKEQQLDLQKILGIEGIASRVYFQNIFRDYNWKARRPRAKTDPVNVLLDIGYTLLFNIIDALLNIYGFDTYKGVYHQEFYQRKSLVCDLVEPFRPLIDTNIRKAYNLGRVKEDDFLVRDNRYLLLGEKAKPYTTFLLETLVKNKGKMFLYIQSYYRCFMRGSDIEKYPIFDMNNRE